MIQYLCPLSFTLHSTDSTRSLMLHVHSCSWRDDPTSLHGLGDGKVVSKVGKVGMSGCLLVRTRHDAIPVQVRDRREQDLQLRGKG